MLATEFAPPRDTGMMWSNWRLCFAPHWAHWPPSRRHTSLRTASGICVRLVCSKGRGAAGEWNRMEVICDGDAITNILNGYVVNVGTGSSLTQGKIQFQSEGAEVFFRKIEVRPLLK